MNIYNLKPKKKCLRFILIVCILLFSNVSNLLGQNKFNKLDSLGRKQGYWKVFLDKEFHLTDSVNSYYYAFSYYDGGKQIIFYRKSLLYANSSLDFNGKIGLKGVPIPIDGVVTRKRKRRQFICTFQNGFLKKDEEIVGIKPDRVRYNQKCVIDFDKRYQELEGSYLVEDIDNAGNVLYSRYYAKKDGKWKFIIVK